MNFSLTPIGINLDGSLSKQTRLMARLAECVDLKAHVRCLRGSRIDALDWVTFGAALKQIKNRHSGPWICFYGRSDLHKFSAILIETFYKDLGLTALILDGHADWAANLVGGRGRGWLTRLLTMWNVQAVHLAGISRPGLGATAFWRGLFKELTDGRLKFYPYRQEKIRLPFYYGTSEVPDLSLSGRFWGTECSVETVLKSGPRKFFERLALRLQGQRIYLSIDKSCLVCGRHRSGRRRDGFLLEEFIEGLTYLHKHIRIIGADICGTVDGDEAVNLKILDALSA